ncbi:CDP-alcohol phosphatidyltransferase family protein [Aestuariibaculum lutulentum]|uniref:CDP-alcohol phosphatidyltransferase family protein n=1 Tax=Aestuariibaculum lutulentum TaxID=2920935 RepID=A0ABS9RGK0_9FLAO|nr:CDP-alcohol phosphatidyltransferase family protein [Aestuariibaculum lutulentum]MCH4551217.1 CDP-alcohol phosphatidyltransferase family protein [Aestuariibaculum lutulentum]
MKKHIPNALTLLNLFCGSIAVIYAVNDNFSSAALFVFLGIFFDFFDGFAARKLGVSSELGLQLDSLADMVTSGVIPGIVMYKMLELTQEKSLVMQVLHDWNSDIELTGFKLSALPLIGLCITLASAYRLAKFNLDDEQKTYFKGLPTPANTLLIVSLPLILEFQNSDAINSIIINKWFLIGLTALSCYLLNSNIKLFALKFKDFSFKANALRYTFIILCVVLLIVLQYAAIPLIILTYILLSLWDNATSK